ncbi:pyroglutamyl-peptidase I family protein [Halalkalicoccus jeotgali]|uniref:Pyroglutamyl-peptidase I n=1 Tax=Halalkalicoccus jeotgali (strain DSM 18796 / CECT 7217 / JCM 14584 / KCTC 4019 / B3) TaxID=795797 RepID=D8J620_HALJB|nr:pyrrolidone-carboxylate peptidase [Halalkalicoccus jeotgali]ADJ13826.1 pyrrolidone-carboxylate peptidase [Halalkalicoccus jeotgali B3]ELY34128.1 pyrrolidone-carboxylate peptidase [Halalkalicoccus jeotgali B3]
MTVLLTGYEPFAERETNPSERLATRLDGTRLGSHDVLGRVLPVEFDRVAAELETLIEGTNPDLVLSTGLAAGRSAISVERVAINVADAAGTPDNGGVSPHDERIDPRGPDARLASIPVVPCVQSLLEADIPARVSNTAGTHCCNYALYTARTATDAPAGFVHLPLTPGMAARDAGETATGAGSVPPSMDLETQRRALELLVKRCLRGTPAP